VEFLVKAPRSPARKGGAVRHRDPGRGRERIPLTIADSDAKAGTISLVFQEVGASTMLLGRLEKGSRSRTSPGRSASRRTSRSRRAVVCVGGGIGIAPIHPIAKAMKAAATR